MVKQGSKSIVIKWKTGGAALSSVTKESSHEYKNNNQGSNTKSRERKRAKTKTRIGSQRMHLSSLSLKNSRTKNGAPQPKP